MILQLAQIAACPEPDFTLRKMPPPIVAFWLLRAAPFPHAEREDYTIGMIVKQKPDDFVVEELSTVHPSDQGAISLYRLEKRGWTTPDALQVIRQRWKIDHRRMSHGGMKDRHAHTVQHFSIFRGPRRQLHHSGITVTYLGQVEEPFSSRHIQANRFRVVLRSLADAELEYAQAALQEVAQYGVPNYFDDQRFGSVTGHGEFLAKSMMLGDFEHALKLALTAPYAHDLSAKKKEKTILRNHWGDWVRCKAELERSHARSLVDYLVHHPDDFRGTLARMQPELRGFFLSAYQSHLWNRMLALWLRRNVPADQLIDVHLCLGEFPIHRTLLPEKQRSLAELALPLPSTRMVWAAEGDDPRRAIFEQILAEEKIEEAHFKLKGLKDLFFSRGERAGLCLPVGLESTAGDDEIHPGKRKLALAFELPRGAYATLIVKRATVLASGGRKPPDTSSEGDVAGSPGRLRGSARQDIT